MISWKKIAFIFLTYAFVAVTAAAFPSANSLEYFLLRQDDQPLHGDRMSLLNYLIENPHIGQELQRNGRIRLVLGKKIPDDQRKQLVISLEQFLATIGVNPKKIRIEIIKAKTDEMGRPLGAKFGEVPEEKQASIIVDNAQLTKNSISSFAIGTLNCISDCLAKLINDPISVPRNLLREIAYPFKALYQSASTPSIIDLSQGTLAKLPGVIGGVTTAYRDYLNAEAAMANYGVHAGLIVALSTFHGPFANIWMDYQRRLEKERGTAYQAVHNFFYGQLWPVVFITNSWLAGIPNAFPGPTYITISVVTSAVDAPISTAGFQGLNQLSEKGTLPTWVRNGIQVWVRDSIFTMQASALGTANYEMFALMYALNQATSASLYLASQLALQKTTLVITEKDLALTKAFQDAFPSAVQTTPITRSKIRRWLDPIFARMRLAFGFPDQNCADVMTQ